ncbi:hypothetical protein JX265_012026 [Neoarthrinium moseri]|uniref:Uncharacterized protein n=1 Tax=Neoarthrinium moseri TaxID=1658444 RepID=A0A9P9WBF5_9PEZI|nr:hypothetical protein JX265_012026 [Neoarthrinium moseri]
MKPHVKFDFITLHYIWIIFMGLLSLVVIYPMGNVAAIDAYFFGASASTESGLNTVDVKDLQTYQQLYLYFIPIFTNLGFINIVVVIVRLHRFHQSIQKKASSLAHRDRMLGLQMDLEQGPTDQQPQTSEVNEKLEVETEPKPLEQRTAARITFVADLAAPSSESKALHIPPPRERDNGYPVVERDILSTDDNAIQPIPQGSNRMSSFRRRSIDAGHRLSNARSLERAVSSMFVLRPDRSHDRTISTAGTGSTPNVVKQLPQLSKQATIGRNSRFRNLTIHDRQLLGGIEYRSLRLLLRIVSVYFFGVHIFGAICLVPWIHRADSKYTEYLDSIGQDKTWWSVFMHKRVVLSDIVDV